MIVRFDTEKEAKEKFETLRQKHCPETSYSTWFIVRIKNQDDNVPIMYQLGIIRYGEKPDFAAIEVLINGAKIVNLLTAMKIVDLMQEV